MSAPRRARLRAPAKINLDLRVLYRRPDGFHELRTIFQTISLADTIDLSFTPGPRTAITMDSSVEIENNLCVRAAGMALDAMRKSGRVEIRLLKKIPMGAGLGGGSTDAAAILMALPVLAGGRLDLAALHCLATQLGSDVPFFLLGGRAAALGRGEELYPLPDAPLARGVVVAPELHVSTPEAYRALSRRLTVEAQQNKMVSFQWQAWGLSGEPPQNDFEPVVFEKHPELAALKRRLSRLGADAALMTGSGSAVFGLFADRERFARALQGFKDVRVFPITLTGRARYRWQWWRQLRAHTTIQRLWPPRSRYVR